MHRNFRIHLDYRIIEYQWYGKEHARLFADFQPIAISILEIYRLNNFCDISSVILLSIAWNKQTDRLLLSVRQPSQHQYSTLVGQYKPKRSLIGGEVNNLESEILYFCEGGGG